MATEQPGFRIGTQVATSSLAALQYGAVKVDSAGKIVATGTAGEKILGILQNKPAAGEVADVLTVGVSKVRAGAAISAGALLMANASGKVITAATVGSTVIGWALEAAGAADEFITAYIHPGMGVV